MAEAWSSAPLWILGQQQSESESCSVLSDSFWPMDSQSTEFSRPEYWSGYPFSSPRDLPNLGIEPRSPTLQVDSLPTEPQGKPKNAGVGSLSLLQWIFLTRESNWACIAGRFFTNWVMREAPERIFQFLLVQVYLPKRRKGSESIITGLHISE